MNIPVIVERMLGGLKMAFSIFAELVAFAFSAIILVNSGVQDHQPDHGTDDFLPRRGCHHVLHRTCRLCPEVLNIVYGYEPLRHRQGKYPRSAPGEGGQPGGQSEKGGGVNYGNGVFGNHYTCVGGAADRGVPISYAIGISPWPPSLQMVSLDVSVLTAAQRTFVA